MRLTTAQALIKFLNQQYIEIDGKEQKLFKGIFTIFGHGNVLGIGQALEEDSGDLEVYQGRNEQGMAHAATAFAKQNNHKQLIACTTSVGPGSANMVTAAATATANNIPLLLLPGDIFASRQPDPVLQQIEQPHDASISTNDVFRPVSKYWDRITRPEQLMSAMINAMRVLTNQGETGAVTISLPQDVQGEAYDYPDIFFKKRLHRFNRRRPVDYELMEAVELITNKKKPLIICGGGVRISEAASAISEFAENFNIPIVETQAGKSVLPSTHLLNVGGIGVTGNKAANELAKVADLIIGVGTRFTDFTTSSKHLFQNEQVDFLTINISDYHAGKLDATKIIADAKAGLIDLQEQLMLSNYRSAYNEEISNVKADWQVELNRLYEADFDEIDFQPEVSGHFEKELNEYKAVLGTSLTQTSVIGKINETIDEEAIIVGAAGSLPGDLQRMWVSKMPNTYHMEYGYSCMGYEISGALGVKMAEPNKEVYAMVGDGSYMMLHSEIMTSIQENKKINVLLFDNAGFGCINNLQMGNGMGSFATEFRQRNKDTRQLNGTILSVDYAQSAAAYGAVTYSVRTLEELTVALEDAKKQSVSTLIDIKVLPKTMTSGYGAWWHVGVSEISKQDQINIAYEDKENQLRAARKY
ncbi:3D-(3,5/4)-trihydroxycyclohexane-1,2-dione acylhydrolase (decyclizing) [Sporosarcina sp. Marseille-Q4063]|uniref:3D-(3,5/4)-trihydroxycyclohexane-1,2-dione acylhydrolase (decyclizing) n=1 Tax=Sporosarcina sp. Marseille-Q4063 TaxID=2810514 RepID=UPI001BB00B7F|nr:3D-(3,5/4)-trihydroxycyclohexane-1,2-dione acylhydrolase (decyclizing) [Sporosarcina sp. Marseille-Q4063]QUW21505.1 3D-(3,5/4)-trihydroxycyclohexane-1,2-dione acylhydrolase (decyclizing) [Sporosarcina sp. Marseille-Q4063]